jgi:hypothetical protein
MYFRKEKRKKRKKNKLRQAYLRWGCTKKVKTVIVALRI